MKSIKWTKEYTEWCVLAALLGILYALGRDHFHLKHTGEFMIVLIVLVALLLVAFVLLERRSS